MTQLGKMIGSFGPYCIFQTRDGIFVRHETLSADPARPDRPKRTYRTINALPVATRDEADQVIEQAMFGPVVDALADAGRKLASELATAAPIIHQRFISEVKASAPGVIVAFDLLRGKIQ